MAPFLKEWFLSQNLQMVGQLKYRMLTLDDRHFHELYTNHFTPYFANLKHCVNSLCKIIARNNCKGATHFDIIKLFCNTTETLPNLKLGYIKMSGPVFKRHHPDNETADTIPDELKPEFMQFPTTICDDQNPKKKKTQIEEDLESDWVLVERED